jgi:hypothetical protein
VEISAIGHIESCQNYAEIRQRQTLRFIQRVFRNAATRSLTALQNTIVIHPGGSISSGRFVGRLVFDGFRHCSAI